LRGFRFEIRLGPPDETKVMTQTAVQPTQSAELESEAKMWARAEESLRLAERVWESRDVSAIASSFSEDCIVRYADLPIIHGREALARFLDARFRRCRNYTIKKRLLAVAPGRITNSLEGAWIDVETNEAIKVFGLEMSLRRDGKIAEWYVGCSPLASDKRERLPFVASDYVG
jgi:nuclear transport factor 2 (NTF2) superfamily protein